MHPQHMAAGAAQICSAFFSFSSLFLKFFPTKSAMERTDTVCMEPDGGECWQDFRGGNGVKPVLLLLIITVRII